MLKIKFVMLCSLLGALMNVSANTTGNHKSSYIFTIDTNDTSREQVVCNIRDPHSKNFISTHAHIQPGMTIADFGCGIGSMTRWLAEQTGPTGTVHGVDQSSDLIETAQNQSIQHSNIIYHASNVNDISFEENSLDVIYCRVLLVHLQDQESVLKKFHSWLKPGGQLICEDIVSHTFHTYPLIPEITEIENLVNQIAQKRNLNYDTGKIMSVKMKDVGFTPQAIQFIQPTVPFALGKDYLCKLLRQVAPTFAELDIAVHEQVEDLITRLHNVDPASVSYYAFPLMGQVVGIKN